MPETSTKELRLLGEFMKQKNFQPPRRRDYIRFYADGLAEKWGVERDVAKNLVKTYGDRAFDVARLAAHNKALGERLVPGQPFIRAEVQYHIEQEMSQSPLDSLCRRMRIAFLSRKDLFAALPVVVDIYARNYNWDAERKAQELLKVKNTLIELEF